MKCVHGVRMDKECIWCINGKEPHNSELLIIGAGEPYTKDTEIRDLKQEIKDLKNSLAFYTKRVNELEAHKHDFPEPYLTMICNILANGKIKP